MKLTLFESDMGDCLLLEAATGQLMLCDGGMKTSLKEHVRAELSALRDAGRDLELVYVSHIDNDHINGVLQLLEDEAEWRVFDDHEASNDPIRRPKVPRPPRIKGILHNGFHAQVKANNKEIANLLVASASSLYASAVPALIHEADEMQGIAAGIKEALIVSGLIGPRALRIPLNKPPGVAEEAKLLYAGKPGETFALGSMRFTLIGPTSKELRDLGQGWKNWMKAQPDEVKKVRAELKKRIEEFSSGALTTTPYDLGGWNGIPDHEKVTAPNVASLMFLVEETGAGNATKRILLTGDAQQDFIIKGLERKGFLDPGFIHLDVLKVQHHGSEHNMDAAFARKVSADHYVFCGNGSHGNPDLGVIDMVYASRRGDASVRTLAPQAQNRDFHFWFSTTSAAAPDGSERRDKFAEVEDRVAELKADSGGRLKVHYNQGSSIALAV